ncbi:MAG TPA: hypothetical protein VGK75_06650 [Casimicrobiaceae bacterium]
MRRSDGPRPRNADLWREANACPLNIVPPAIPSERTSAGVALVSFAGQATRLCGDVQMMQ